jgi:hypothetical protein
MKINKILLGLFAVLLIGCTPEEIPQPKKECFRVLSYRDEFYPNGFPIQISGQTVYKRRFYVFLDLQTGKITDGYSFFQFEEVGYDICNDIKI